MYKVLIVDDDKSIIAMLREYSIWESYGFAIGEVAYDGIEALEKLDNQKIDLVITDIRMPGMDGLELLGELRVRKVDSCFMLMSTYNDFEYAQQGIRLGVFDYMMKPVEESVLCEALERIKRHLDEKKLQQSKANEEKARLIEDNLEFYYPKSQERRLADLLLAGSQGIIEEASSICLELIELTNQDVVKSGILLEKMILQLREELNRCFPWLGTLEEIVFDSNVMSAESLEDSKEKFLLRISRMMEIIRKYELHRPDSVVGKTCRYVMEHVEENIKLDDIASEVHVSRDYIGKLFKQKTGSNFIDYVTKVKMEHAKYLIGTGQYRNYEVCEKLGYSRPDYFSRLFKEYTGYTPLQFRKISS
jgi:two-component system response regulator YesN